MELFLNLAWVLVAGTLVYRWLEGGGSNNPDWRPQLIAIAVLIAILFPVISMSDDLLTVQSTFEADNYLRRDHLAPSATPVPPGLAIVTAVIFAGFGFGFMRFAAPSRLPIEKPQRFEITTISNRPPPSV
jgi:hypothetical protein